METISQWLLTFLGNALWQALVITAAALGCDRLMRNAPARQRHFLWVAALALCVLLPLLSTSGPLRDQAPTSAAGKAVSIQVEARDSIPPQSSSELTEFIRPRSRTFSLPSILAMLALACYLLSLLFHMIKLWRAWRQTKALLSASHKREIPERLGLIKQQCQGAFGLKGVTLLCSSEIAGPITTGSRSIVLPEALFDSEAPDLLSAAIGHEMAHIKRCDFAFNLIYEFLSMPLAFHPVIIFIKRRIKETRELACDELVTERLLDAPAYARSLLRLADSAMGFHRPAYSLGVFEAGILEKRVMKLIERKPHLSKKGKTFILAAVVSLLTASSVVAAVFSLKIEQRAEEKNQIDGAWELFLTEDGQDPKGSVFGFPLGLSLKLNGKRPVGSIWFPLMTGTGTGLRQSVAPEEVILARRALLDSTFNDRLLSFRIDRDNKGDLIEMTLEPTGERFSGRWKVLRSGESGALRGARKESFETWLTGRWTAVLLSEDGTEIEGELIVKADGGPLTAKTIFNIAGAKEEWKLVEVRTADSETYSFQVFNGEETFKADLKLTNDQFEGTWKTMRKGGPGGRIKLIRKK